MVEYWWHNFNSYSKKINILLNTNDEMNQDKD